MKKIVLIALFLILTLTACIPGHLKSPDNEHSSIIGVRVNHRAPIRFFQHHASDVYFLKLNDEDEIEKGGKIFKSNYHFFSYVYLINAEPGTYVIVATRYVKTPPPDTNKKEKKDPLKEKSEPPEYVYTLFNKSLAEASKVTVKPGAIAFAGDIALNQDILLFNISRTDMIQAKYMTELEIEPDLTLYQGILHKLGREREREINFMKKARGHFKGTSWLTLIKSRIEELEMNQ